jgi:hypothetical protein
MGFIPDSDLIFRLSYRVAVKEYVFLKVITQGQFISLIGKLLVVIKLIKMSG